MGYLGVRRRTRVARLSGRQVEPVRSAPTRRTPTPSPMKDIESFDDKRAGEGEYFADLDSWEDPGSEGSRFGRRLGCKRSANAPPTSVRGPVHEARRRPRIPQPTRVCTSNIDQLTPKLDGPFPSTLNAGTPTNLARTDEGTLNGAPLLVGIGIHHKPIFAQ
ncbi:hypothetical protein FA13DRAFT_858328 [Coprinellus micaceus]|uniref:Uncharacterized protein n=1 Tax=Coprinellus micaceus TaxID=71717 RepID=A0A4Y7T0Z7_COPMI|nr:hypothetical protein FA13DRAFT_858328 [Coprinellus micaceus]